MELLTSSTINIRLILFLPDVSKVAGFLAIFDHIVMSENAPSNRFQVTRTIFENYLKFLLYISTPRKWNGAIFGAEIQRQPYHPFDLCLVAVLRQRFHKLAYTMATDHCNKPLHNYDPSISTDDKLSELLPKYGVECMTYFHKQMLSTISRECCHIPSHFKALYFYSRRDYRQTLSLCRKITENERSATPAALSFHVSMLYPFHPLFDDDIIVTLGLLILCETHGKTIDPLWMFMHFSPSVVITYWGTSFRPEFLVQYLILRSLEHLKMDSCEIRKAFHLLKPRFRFETIVKRRIRRKLDRLALRNI